MKARGSVVGLVDGFALATQNIVQGFSGSLSDKLHRRKSPALVGYFLAAIAKPLMGLSTTWQGVFGARVLDEGEKAATANSDGLRGFLEGEVLPWLENRKKELANRPLIREQAFGEALDPDKLERLGRYEVHLDRKLERMLSMLLRLKDLRRESVAG